jgi:hypothetical protein
LHDDVGDLFAARLNGLPETMANGPPSAVAVPVSRPAPALVTTKLACAVVPVAMAPRFNVAGVTPS